MNNYNEEVLRRLRRLEDMLWLTLKLEVKQMANIDDLVSEVADEKTVVAGVSTLMDRLISDLQAARGDQAKIDAVLAAAQANKTALAEAVARGTAADPEAGPTGPAESGPSGPDATELAKPETTGDVGTEASAGTSG